MGLQLGVLSDLHLNTKEARQRFIEVMAEQVDRLALDGLILAGDITPGVATTILYVRECIRELGIPIYYVPGNHELWNRLNGLSTAEIYQLFLDDPNCLSGQTVYLPDGTRLFGDVFWYDYSYGDQTRFTTEQFERKMLKGSRWQDAYYVDWQASDSAVSDRFIQEAKARFEQAHNGRTIFVSHMINHPQLSVPSRRFELWGFFNAFLGSRKLNELIMEYKPEYAICGHVHHRRRFMDGSTEFICPCLGYPKEWRYLAPESRDIGIQIERSLQVIAV